MPTVSITVAPAEVPAVRRALLEVCGLDADALAGACADVARGRAADAAVRVRRRAWRESEALLSQVGAGGPQVDEPRALVADAELVHEVLFAALLEAIDVLERRVGELRRAPFDVAPARAADDRVAALLALVADASRSRP